MYRSVIAVLTLLAVFMSGCTYTAVNAGTGRSIKGSGHRITRDFAVEDFTALHVDSAFHVTVTRGDAYQVAVTIDDNLMDYVVAERTGDTLRLALDSSKFNSFTSNGQEATITMPELKSVRLNGASDITFTGFGQVEKFEAQLEGASNLRGDIDATEINVDAGGASKVNLEGSGGKLALSLNGSSKAGLERLAVENATVQMHGASTATVNATSGLDYRLSGASKLRYVGNPERDGTTEGSSKVEEL